MGRKVAASLVAGLAAAVVLPFLPVGTVDADFATETANLTRAQVLQQAGQAMLSQANASTGNVLSLLRNL